MDITKNFKKRWISLKKENRLKEEELLPFDKEIATKSFEDLLPKKITLSPEDLELREKLNNQGSYSNHELLKMYELNRIYGHEEDSFEEDVITPLQKQIEASKKYGIKLPQNYIDFFSNIEYCNRFRCYAERFSTDKPILPFENQDQYYVLNIGTADYGGGESWYYILMDKEGNHCMLFSNFELLDSGKFRRDGYNTHPEFIICSENFDEFIKRVLLDFRHRESKVV